MGMKEYLTSQKSAAPLAMFRVLFGFIMVVSIIRFALNGWIYELYVKPDFFFTYYGFEWVTPLGEVGMYLLFLVMGLAAVGIMLGYYYRVAAVLFFLAFSYVELIDKTNYLNHYYFVSIISFLLIIVPAHRYFSLDVMRRSDLEVSTVPSWTINILKLQLGLVYFYAGLAKLNPDWLFNAMPLKLWLPANAHLPLIGPLLEYTSTAYLFSWTGAFYDLFIVFFLLYKPTRKFAYVAVIAFHLMTSALFQIGMFPYIMILCTLIYFSEEFHEQCIAKLRELWSKVAIWKSEVTGTSQHTSKKRSLTLSKSASTILTVVLVLHFLLQVLVPLRFALYPGNLFWTEEGYRFSWRVMLMEKAGYATFHVRNSETGKSWEVSNWEHLTPNQEKMMSTQPDMILQFAHHLEDKYKQQGLEDVEIKAEAYVTLNGRRSRLMIDPEVDLTEESRGFEHKEWILPYPDNQKSWLGSNSR
ncbi:HTTM domain-containing protein [Aliifodinibius sp. S!AR15-10]|uniref:HTTM domain-containing protein n=1 Tax=Aliifodinibius sp. S!AR15-10 TaxID=2950437 RepID=UPI0028586C10|nr:HTTM domain-containing protein [Aliifodinibius sp. S!AR15-10]MDR8392496.1 HTTM domain-containing protein [Aliifodinibius sp. S!AR15-10]